jgi:RecB family exonuclease
LVRVPDLQAMHRALAECVTADTSTRLALVVPTSGAAEALRRTFEQLSVTTDQFDLVTRDELYVRLHEGLLSAPPMLTAFEREVLLTRAAAAASAGTPAPFRLRPGLIVEILAFYDELRRRDRSIADFDRLMTESLQASAEIDRGAERLFRQTQFLAAAFARFEALVESSGRLDEHALRRWLLAHDGPPAYRRVVVSVADQAADPRGLWTADYDMLARLPGLETLDVIATENVLAAGFHQRVHDVLPGIDEERRGVPAQPPVLVTPPEAVGDVPSRWFVSRDREEELAELVRGLDSVAGRTAVVFQRPLPYLYLARSVFADAGQPYQALDSLPLAAEPFAAALDVIFAFVVAAANRASTVDLLSSPHWQFPHLSGTPVSVRARVSALDARLREVKYFGGWDRLNALVEHEAFTSSGLTSASTGRSRRPRADAGEALQAAVAAAEALRPLREASHASGQLHALLDFIRAHERPPEGDAAWASRHLRARAAVVGALESLADAQARHDDAPLPVDRLAGAVRRWIEGQTFSPRTGSRGMLLLDAPAAAYADVDELRLVGLVEHDWPERVRRSIFYPSSLLSQLGWPNETDRLAAARARFHDLLRLPRTRVSVSTFTLEDDAIVSGSPFLQELETSGLPLERTAAASLERPTVLFAHEALFENPPRPFGDSAEAAAWLALRAGRSPGDNEAYHGAAGPRAPGVYAISHVERYLDCPFKYFAARVLRLDEERDDESGLSPQERGQLLHEVFETFFARWHERGGRAITADSLDDALELFRSVAESTLARLPEADRALERTYLLGSAVAAGLGERAFNFEIEQETPVLERLLEHGLEGEFEFKGADGPRKIRIRAKADRIDLLADGTLRVIDYKLGRAPKAARALQLPIYGLCAEQHLEGRHGRAWTVSSAGYVAFKEKNPFISLGAAAALQAALDDGAARFVAAVDGIERGEFPVRPDEPFWCTRCGYAGVCRKDYVGDE